MSLPFDFSQNLKSEFDESAVAAEKTKKVGRKRGPIWQYFDLTDDGKACCKQRKTSLEQPCNAMYAAACPSSMEYHLEKMHKTEFAEFLSIKEAHEQTMKSKKSKFQTDTDEKSADSIDSSSISPKVTENDSMWKRSDEKLALALVCSGASLNFVNCSEVREFFRFLNYRYPVPHRNKITKLVDGLFDRIFANSKRAVGQAKKVAICVDLWSRKNMKTTFVGVSAHFFSPKDHRRHKVLLAVDAISSPHTATKIKEITDKVS